MTKIAAALLAVPVAGMALAIYMLAQPTFVSAAVATVGRTTEVCVTNAAGGTIVSNAASALPSRSSFEVQNLGPNSIYCTIDGDAPVVGSQGRKISTDGSWAVDAGPSVTVRCIAATAAQVTPACAMLSEVR